ncbi:MAG TPA: GNAT family N-acetyltransferase [Dehalococcoidia bacterium]|nr:GNAT family N-acetyltransferase [Dehalococcoidia bacterium]
MPPATNDVTVRVAHERDLAALLGLYALLSDETRTTAPSEAERRALGDVLADRRQRLFVAERAGAVVGSVTLIVVTNLTHDGRPYGIIENVVVREDARRGGIGAALMREAIAAAREAGCYKVALTSNMRRAEAHAFYERLRFVTTQRAFRLDV